jgi:hypothetical protein
MSLRSRIVKLEAGPSNDRDLRAAEELLHRHAEVEVAMIFGTDTNPHEVAWARMAEKSGRIAAAADFVRRYWRVRGVDIDERHRREVEEIQGQIREIFGLPEAVDG